jgi:hypothetical protein
MTVIKVKNKKQETTLQRYLEVTQVLQIILKKFCEFGP